MRPVRLDLRRFGASCEGAAILEFALALPILVVLVGGCFELGRALLVYRSMGDAARAGARSLARVPDPTCRPGCSPGAARSLALATDQIVENARVPPRTITVAIVPDPPYGTVGVRAEVALATDLLGVVGLERLLTLRLARFEARIGR